MKRCPKCGAIIKYNSYFGAYICLTPKCDYQDIKPREARAKMMKELRETGQLHINQLARAK